MSLVELPSQTASDRCEQPDQTAAIRGARLSELETPVILDTNVVSELMRTEPHPAVLSWVGSQPRGALYTTSVTQAEVLYGIALLPGGKRREALAATADA